MKLISDEDFNNRIVRGLLRRFPTLDLVRVQNVGLMERRDTEVLEWAADENRLVLTHDFATMIDFAYGRVAQGLKMPGIIAIPQDLAIGQAIDEISFLTEYSIENEWENQVVFLPLK
jgi:predicted nuclease of predicted toxin-antitoxin system